MASGMLGNLTELSRHLEYHGMVPRILDLDERVQLVGAIGFASVGASGFTRVNCSWIVFVNRERKWKFEDSRVLPHSEPDEGNRCGNARRPADLGNPLINLS